MKKLFGDAFVLSAKLQHKILGAASEKQTNSGASPVLELSIHATKGLENLVRLSFSVSKLVCMQLLRV
jgi:hypothetical protein